MGKLKFNMHCSSRQIIVKYNQDLCPIPTVDELNTKVWGEGFYATITLKEEFDEIWNTGIYSKSLTATGIPVCR